MNPDTLGGDLRRGSYFIVTRWVREKANVSTTNPAPGLLVRDTSAEPARDAIETGPNRALTDAVCEVLAKDEPLILVRVHLCPPMGEYTTFRIVLDLREFEYRKAAPKFVRAMIAPRPRRTGIIQPIFTQETILPCPPTPPR